MKAKKLSFSLVLVLLLCLSPRGINLSLHAAARAQWTVMVYMAANNNIEEDSMIPLMEMAAVGSSANLNIVVQLTRPATYTGFYGDWGGTRRFLITKSSGEVSSGDFQISPSRFEAYLKAQGNIDQASLDQFDHASPAEQSSTVLQDTVPVVDPSVPLLPLQVTDLQDLGSNVNSGDGATLSDFGTWAVQNYPADHYALAIWDHGGGWSMIASDDTLGPDGITMPALGQALGSIKAAAGVDKLDLLDLDGCLMAQLPVAVTVAPDARYMLASEELVPGYSFNYIDLLTTLASGSDSTGLDAARAAVTSYVKMYGSLGTDVASSYDLGLIDLSKIDGVVTALNNFSTTVQASQDDELKPIGTARHKALEFASIGQDRDTDDQFSSVDLDDFMRIMSTLSADDSVKKTAQDVISAVQSAVVYHKASDSLRNANGLSVFFPRNQEVFQNAEGQRYTQEFGSSLAGWQTFLDTFYGTAQKDAETAAAQTPLKLSITGVVPGGDTPVNASNNPVISFDLSGTDIADVTAYVMLDTDTTTSVLDAFPVNPPQTGSDENTINSYPDGSSTQSLKWDVTVPTISDGGISIPILITSDSDDDSQGFINGVYTDSYTGQSANAFLTVDLNTMKILSLWGSQTSSSGVETVAELHATPGDTFEPLAESIDSNGNTQDSPSGKILTFGDTLFTVSYVPAPAGNYTIDLEVEDMAGNTAYDQAPLSVINP